jgi:outer membrane beta-barrel protein
MLSLGAEYLPNIERREVVTPGIDSANFELSSFVSLLSVQEYTVASLIGLRLALHLNESLFIEGNLSQADIGSSTFERADNSVQFSDRRYTDYHLSTGWHLLQGYSSFGKRRMIHNTYVIGGAGITNFANKNNFTYNFGLGHRLLINEHVGIRLEGRDYVVNYDTPLIGSSGTQHNLALSFGLSLFF